ncbi:hypothetical protein ACN38_g3136 [Penicillium nordicum]|uniref:Uncharacterized protein n=1 Tax=Penicillium nordicum TaxID=229535 RepID=A0A0M8P8T3_9EURO|nr:hypothetical protein ACN38_g3136 [Penicillium nordicum]
MKSSRATRKKNKKRKRKDNIKGAEPSGRKILSWALGRLNSPNFDVASGSTLFVTPCEVFNSGQRTVEAVSTYWVIPCERGLTFQMRR